MASTVNAASTPTRSLKVLDQLFKRPTNRLILCFDGTGISFRGDSADSNIVKLYSKFEQSASNQKHYYQRESDAVATYSTGSFITPLARLTIR